MILHDSEFLNALFEQCPLIQVQTSIRLNNKKFSEQYGGGGGGVIVNGIKPGNATHSGEGFGGGAYGYSSSNGWPGCVLIET